MSKLNLSESELRLMQENENLRVQLEQCKALLNKALSCEELGLQGSIKLLISEHNKATTNKHLLKEEIRRAKDLLNSGDAKKSKDFLSNLLQNFDKIYG